MPSNHVSLALNIRGADVKYLHVSLNMLGYTIPNHELEEQVFDAGTRDALLQLQARHHFPRTGVLDDPRAVLESSVAGAETDQYGVEGRVFFDYELPDRRGRSPDVLPTAYLLLRKADISFSNKPNDKKESNTCLT